MNEFELIAEMLQDLNQRMCYMEPWREDENFKQLHSRLMALIEMVNQARRKLNPHVP